MVVLYRQRQQPGIRSRTSLLSIALAALIRTGVLVHMSAPTGRRQASGDLAVAAMTASTLHARALHGHFAELLHHTEVDQLSGLHFRHVLGDAVCDERGPARCLPRFACG